MGSRRRHPGSTAFIIALTLLVIGVVSWRLLERNSGKLDTPRQQVGTTSTGAAASPANTITTTTQPAADPTAEQTQDPLGGAIASYAQGRLGVITAAVEDLQTGQTWRLHPGDPQATASIVKVDVMATLFAQASAESRPLTTEQQALLSNMIELSDNTATTTLWTDVGSAPGIRAFNDRVGMTATTPSLCISCSGFPWPGWGLTTTTPADQIALLRTIVEPNTLLTTAQRLYALDLMENVTPSERWGVSSGPPTSVTVALKNGWVPLAANDWQINSIGWVDGEGRNYLIAVLTTSNPTEQYGIQTIDDISSHVFGRMAP